MLKHKSSTLKINFGYMDCPSCKQEVSLNYYVPGLSETIDEACEYKQKI